MITGRQNGPSARRTAMPQSQMMTSGAVAYGTAPSLRPIRKISLDRSAKVGSRPTTAVQGWARAFLREGL